MYVTLAIGIRISCFIHHECAHTIIRLTVFLCLLVAALTIQDSEAQAENLGQRPLSFRVLRDVSNEVGIGEVCCDTTAHTFLQERANSVHVPYGGGAIWLKIENVGDAGLIQLSPVIDEVTLYFRSRGAETWSKVYTGDQIASDRRLFTSPFMVLPIGKDADRENIYIRIVQSTAISIEVTAWQLPAFLEMQNADRAVKIFLFGFILAIVVYNLFVTFLLQDAAFLFNALCILSLLLLSLYLSGYGTLHFWGGWVGWSNTILSISLYLSILFGSVFVWLFLRSKNETPDNIWPIFIAPGIATIGAILSIVLPFWQTLLIMILSGIVFLTTLLFLTIMRGLRGDIKARILLAPTIFAIIPGLLLVVLNKIFGWIPINLGNNGLEITLCLEAIFFSLALASRIKIAEQVTQKVQSSLLELRAESAAGSIRAQDAERKRLALELHDGVGQDLLVIQGELKKLRRQAQSKSSSSILSEIIQDSSTILKELRRISHDMYPAAIEHLGLKRAMQSLLEKFENSTQIETLARLEFDESRLGGDVQLHIYRIVQECLANINRHSSAKQCTIEMHESKKDLQITVEDDGVGINHDMDLIQLKRGLGFVSIEERVKVINGKWRLGRGQLGGLKVNISVPIMRSSQ